MSTDANDLALGWRLGWVIYSPDTDDYLGSVADAGPMYGLAWCSAPDHALRWDSIVDAERVAHERTANQAEPGNRQYRVDVSELLDNGTRLTARPAAYIVPLKERLLSQADVAALGFSSDFRDIAGRLGIRPDHARVVVERPDAVTHHLGSGATLYVRRVAGLRRHLLVMVDMMGERPQIIAAWPVPLSAAGPSPSPISALQALCSAAGNMMVLRGDRTPLVFGERHPHVPEDLSNVVSVEGSKEGLLQLRLGRDRQTGEMLMGWAYSIDENRLASLLAQ